MPEPPRALPFVDAHARRLAVPPARAWETLARALARAFRGRAAEGYARLIGCEPAKIAGAFPSVGSTVAGFRVAAEDAPRALALAGRHRYATYELVFRLEAEDEGRATRLRPRRAPSSTGRQGDSTARPCSGRAGTSSACAGSSRRWRGRRGGGRGVVVARRRRVIL